MILLACRMMDSVGGALAGGSSFTRIGIIFPLSVVGRLIRLTVVAPRMSEAQGRERHGTEYSADVASYYL